MHPKSLIWLVASTQNDVRELGLLSSEMDSGVASISFSGGLFHFTPGLTTKHINQGE